MCCSGSQRCERISAFEHCVYASSISTRMPSFGGLPSTSLRREQLLVRDQRRAAVDAERVVDARDHEQEPDVRVREDVPQRVGEAIAGPVGNQQGSLVEDPDEPGRVAARAHVAVAVRRRSRQAHERRPLDELPRQVVQPARHLRDDELVGRSDQLAQLGFAADAGERRHAEDATQARPRSRDTGRVGEKPTVPLGQLVLQCGMLDEAQLEIALAEHLSTGVRLGEVLVGHGWLTEAQLERLLDDQRRMAAGEEDVRGIALLETRIAEAEAELSPAPEEPGGDAGPGYVLFVWSPSGYALLNRSGAPPTVGSEVGVSGGMRVVTKIGPSPLPGDSRRCAFLDAP